MEKQAFSGVFLCLWTRVLRHYGGWILFGLGMVSMIGCGRRTPPHSVTTVASFAEGEARQRGNILRLSWKQKQPIPSQTGNQQFRIEEYRVRQGCLDCSWRPVRQFLLPFPSRHFLIKGFSVYFYLPQEPHDLDVHLFKIAHQNRQSENLGQIQIVRFRGFTEFPDLPFLRVSPISAKTLSSWKKLILPEVFPKLPKLRWIKLAWDPQVEKATLRFNQDGELLKHPEYYRVNVYRTVQGIPWPERPLNPKPWTLSFYVDYQTPTSKTFLYHVRWVDSYGNESAPSDSVAVQFLQPDSVSKPLP